jgi:hypothetical protein
MTTIQKLSTAAALAIALQGFSSFAAPVLDDGWLYDQVNTASSPSVSSPYVYDFTSPVTFRITDAFDAGDVYQVYDNSVLILTTTFNGAQAPLSPVGDPSGEAAWTSAQYSHGTVELPAGANSIVVEGDGAGGLPAGFYDRIDSSTPDGGTTAVLLSGTMLGMASLRRKLS